MNKIKMSLVAAIAAAAATTGANAGALDSILSNPKLDIELRPRYEAVDDSVHKDASALTVRTAIGVQAGLFGVDGLNTQLQAMSVDTFGLVTDYNPVDSDYATVADGPQTRMTQANISYASNGFVGIVGRKMVVLDNARFIGNVGWRQMPQTYDLAAAIYNGVENLSLLGAYVTRVNRIFNTPGNGALKDHFDTGSVLLHATYKAMPELTLTAYDYMIQNFADHIGIRATGKIPVGDVKLGYEAEYTTQNDPSLTDEDDAARTGVGSADIKQDASYYKVGLNAAMNGFTVGAAYEFLSDKGDGDLAFSTPLATLHAMNGWADVFLNTPDEGLVDMSVKLAYNAGEYGKLVGIYHNFSSDSKNASGDDDLGSEVDVAYNYKINKQLGMLLKGAWYSEGDDSFGMNDVTKYWVQFDYKFHAEL
ncbi:hypothetical protein [Hydrogenimonas cancrithermarum]|uniref:Alginate export domain-containing protein n=1 Tax=Hydrogenimonas cancrithermarum TaxID=2993563 RepID=A0ABM8FM64_9BACT|nr:hypothetical protein [Hydrogenimonas cancrithermarum]BDY12603.1 hypothetical protein HCR_09150 [Hydrogenimonas cancrithermarum]